ncbi:MAG: hypothetical protein AAGE52_00110 [Myxococcota bacterium]
MAEWPGASRVWWVAWALAVSAFACTKDQSAPVVRDPFIAMQADFADLLRWPRWEVPDIGSTHGHQRGSPSYIYVHGEIPVWGEPMPIGTILAKSVQVGEPTEWEIHAMVKRGGDFNVDGCAQWEWFDLRLNEDQVPEIIWRGEGNAANPGGYGRRPDGTPISCNECHSQVPHTDFAFGRALYGPSD